MKALLLIFKNHATVRIVTPLASSKQHSVEYDHKQGRISSAGIREFSSGPLDCEPTQRFTGLPQN